MLNFEPISINKMEDYIRLYNINKVQNLSASFYYMWFRRKLNNYQWAFSDDLCWVRFQKNNKWQYNIPIGKTPIKGIESLIEQSKDIELVDIPEETASSLAQTNNFSFEEDSEKIEYLFLSENLKSLPGKKYHLRRQNLKYFNWYYDYRFVPIRAKYIKELKQFIKTEFEGIVNKPEFQQSHQLLDNWKTFKQYLSGYILRVNKKTIGVIIGEKQKDEIFIHLQKTHPDYKGASEVLTKLYLEQLMDAPKTNCGLMNIGEIKKQKPEIKHLKFKLTTK